MKNNKLSVRLYGNNHIIGLCKVSHVGLLGMNIDADPLIFPKGTRFEVEILLDEIAGTNQCRLPVVVTSRSLNGVGLTFVDLDDRMCSTLLNTVLHISDQPVVT
jgi:hypothetical protein